MSGEAVWIIVAVIVGLALFGVGRVIMRALWAFVIVFVGLLLVHIYNGGTDGIAVLIALGGGLGITGPLRRMVLRSFLG